jgi:hypothetical protein
LQKCKPVTICDSLLFDSHHQRDHSGQIEDREISKLRGLAFDVQDKMLQRHPGGDDERDDNSVFKSDFHLCQKWEW